MGGGRDMAVETAAVGPGWGRLPGSMEVANG